MNVHLNIPPSRPIRLKGFLHFAVGVRAWRQGVPFACVIASFHVPTSISSVEHSGTAARHTYTPRLRHTAKKV
ncbi:hypothetical protein QCA50_011383 [Cerrena zonata]|uniref:Uncharacterized protein n=1 Tax=Cerrena zonata TaxID=2478898 RepID=A0AAW0G1Z0_9APHY